MPFAITYLGWSGFRIDTGSGPIFVDPPHQAEFPPQGPCFVLLTHGHPEHLSGIRAYLRSAGAAEAMVLASRALCGNLRRAAPARAVTFMPIGPGDVLALADGLGIDIFEWAHLPLLPGGFAANAGHMARLALRPGLAFRIAWAGLSGPAAGPMLGFRVKLGDWQVLACGEGLHRFCDSRAFGGLPRHNLVLVGVEPGDEAVMPDLLRTIGAGTALLYEPHAKWRDAFGMARVDLPALRERIEAAGTDARILVPNVRIRPFRSSRRPADTGKSQVDDQLAAARSTDP